MNNDHCLYCGSSDIIPVDEEHYLEQNLHILQCRNCLAMFTELEQKLEADGTLPDYKPNFNTSDEEAVLDAVWKIWHSNELTLSTHIPGWEHTLELLFLRKHPLKHPAEFMIYRDYWQICDALQHCNILQDTDNYDHFYTCTHLLSLLIINLQNIDYFLSAYSEEQHLRAMQRICGVLANLMGMTILTGRLDPKQINTFAVSIVQKRFDAITVLADQLEDLYSAGRNLEYLKMAARLWNSCMENIYIEGENLNSQDPHFRQYIGLSKEKNRQISKKIAEINTYIRQAEPAAEPNRYPDDCPSEAEARQLTKITLIAAPVILSFIFILIFFSFRKYSGSLPIIDAALNICCAAIPLCIVFLAGVIVWLVSDIKKINKAAEKNKIKRQQIYDRLYKNK